MGKPGNWLICEVSDGMFPDELSVCVKTIGMVASFFVPKNNDKIIVVNGFTLLKVEVLDCDARYALVLLPYEPVECSATVKIEREILCSAPTVAGVMNFKE